VQQYIQQLIKRDPSNVELILTMPEAQDEGVWKYEHLRQFCMELNGLAVRLQKECSPCQGWRKYRKHTASLSIAIAHYRCPIDRHMYVCRICQKFSRTKQSVLDKR